MAYIGQTYRIPCSVGGNNYSPNFDAVPPEAMVDPSKNINLTTGGRTKRGGTAHVNATALPGTYQIMNGYDFRLKSGTRYIMANDSNGVLYRSADLGATAVSLKTGLNPSRRSCYVTFGNELYFCDGLTVPQTWDGAAASTSDITTPALDWGVSNQPKYVVVRNVGASKRLIFFGLSTDNQALYITAANDGKTVNGGTSAKVIMETADGFGIVGGVEFGERFLGFGKRKAYILDDSDASVANWGYVPVQWEGGVAHHDLLVKTPNDLIAMQEDGEIYSVSAAQEYGDYKLASIARPAFIHKWIEDNVNLALIEQFHAIYDRTARCVYFFVVRNGYSRIDTALTYFIDRPPAEAWMVQDNLVHASGYSASSSFEVRESTGKYRVYTGGYDGFLWGLQQTAKNDNGNGFQARFRTPPLPFDNPRVRKKYRRGVIVFNPYGEYIVNVLWWVDNVQQTTRQVTTMGSGGAYGSAVYGSSVYGGQEITDKFFSLGAVGKRVQFEIENSTADQDFYISQIFVDHEILGARAA